MINVFKGFMVITKTYRERILFGNTCNQIDAAKE